MTSQQFLLCDNSSTANFNAWCGAISGALSSAGWSKTADTGQVATWGSVAVPSSAYVYEIWKPGDALQTGSTQFFLRVEYGFSTTNPAVRMSIGAATDGAGNFTGSVKSQIFVVSGLVNQGTLTFECDFSGDINRFAAMLWRNFGGGASLFFVERTKNTSGADNSDGAVIGAAVSATPSSTTGQQVIVFGVGAGNNSNLKCFCAPVNGQNLSGAFNNNVPVSPVFPEYGFYGNPLTTCCFVHSQDVAEGCLFSTTLYGSTRTYLATGNVSITVPANCKACMRYD